MSPLRNSYLPNTILFYLRAFIKTITFWLPWHQQRTTQIQSAKMADLGRLTLEVAHEISTPLTNIAMNLEILRLELAQTEPHIQSRLNRMAINLDKALKITQELKNFSRPDPSEWVAIHIEEAVEGALLLLESQSRQVEITRHYAEPIPEILANFGKLEQLFLNLIRNALEAMQQSGKLVIDIHQEQRMVVVSLRDSGPGIQQALLKKVFEPFFTTHPENGGLGLGLTICQTILQQHGGVLQLIAAKEGGLEAKVLLPLSPNTATQHI